MLNLDIMSMKNQQTANVGYNKVSGNQGLNMKII